MISRLSGIAFTILFLLFYSPFICAGDKNTTAQDQTGEAEKKASPLYRLQAGLGGSSFGVSGGLCFSYQDGHDVFSARIVRSGESILVLFDPVPEETIWDIGVLYGRAMRSRIFLASISAGVGFIGGVKRGPIKDIARDEYERLSRRSIGFPVEVQLALIPLPFLGFGVSAIGNLTFEQSFASILFCIQIGKLK